MAGYRLLWLSYLMSFLSPSRLAYQIRSPLLPSTSTPIHYSLITPSYTYTLKLSLKSGSCVNGTWSPVSMERGRLCQWNLVACVNGTWSPVSMERGRLCQWNVVACVNGTWSPVSMKRGRLCQWNVVASGYRKPYIFSSILRGSRFVQCSSIYNKSVRGDFKKLILLEKIKKPTAVCRYVQ
jgi:hypothetical protein